MKHNLLEFLPLFLAGDLMIPFLLAPAYKGYSHLKQVMSVLGNSKSPLHMIYNVWLVLLGSVIFICNFQIYSVVREKTNIIAAALFSVVCVYAIGACVLSGCFSVGETKILETLSAKIHGYGSVLGFLLFIFAPLLVGLYFFKAANQLLGIFSLGCFAGSIIFFILFIMADKPDYKGTFIALEGLWQRLTLLFMYLPVMALCLLQK